VIVFLRFIGMVNAAIWLGASIFMIGVALAVFSPEMQGALHTSNFEYYRGQILHVVFERYFLFHLICGLVALAHLFAEKLYLGRRTSRFTIGLLLGLLVLNLVNGQWLQPKMNALHQRKYAPNLSQVDHESAAHSFNKWHGMSQTINMLIICGILIYNWRVNNPPDPTMFVTPGKFRG
jgi:hypothetical protein